MNKKGMGFFLVIGGVVLLAVGVYLLISNKREEQAPLLTSASALPVTDTPTVSAPVTTIDTISTDTTSKPDVRTKEARSSFEENKKKGDDFEAYIISLFDKQWFKLKEWRSDKKTADGTFAESAMHPDMEIEYFDHKHSQRFAIECKWRAVFDNGMVNWANEKQIERYKQFEKDKNIKVYVAIGIGGTPDKPEHLYFTALKNIAPYSNQPESYLNKFSRSTETTFYFDTATGTLR